MSFKATLDLIELNYDYFENFSSCISYYTIRLK